MEIITETAKKIIHRKGLKQRAVAILAGYTEKQLSDLLCGRKIMKASDAKRICDALNVTPNELFAVEDYDKVG